MVKTSSRLNAVLQRRAAALQSRSRWLVAVLDLRMELLIIGWLGVFFVAASPRILFPLTPYGDAPGVVAILLPYYLIALAPIAGYRLATGSFPRGQLSAQPSIRLALYGRWREVDVVEARARPDFGPCGFMASLLVGMLLNVPVRTFEFLLSVPAMNGNGAGWGQTIFLIMAGDVIAMNFLYMVCFVMALRAISLFPRMLAIAWGLDVLSQLSIANRVMAAPDLPRSVASAMQGLLDGNITKVLISVGVWLPYLLLSERVNVTYRQRVAA
jgi:hypothetical protein